MSFETQSEQSLLTETQAPIGSSGMPSTMQSLGAEISVLNRLINNKNTELEYLHQQVRGLLHSTIWRRTQSLRTVSYYMQTALQRLVRRVRELRVWAGLTQQHVPPLYGIDTRDYVQWVQRYDSLDEAQRASMRRCITVMPRLPRITILLPMPSACESLALLEQTMGSLQRQGYAHWQLIVLNHGDEKMRGLKSMPRGIQADPRIQWVNCPASGALHTVLPFVEGEFCGWMQLGDLLAEHALFWMATTSLRHPQANFMYSDEDWVDVAGCRQAPYFKPQWNPELLLSHHYTAYFSVYKTPLLRDLQECSGNLDRLGWYDVALRVAFDLMPTAIQHIPRVLYHRYLLAGQKPPDTLCAWGVSEAGGTVLTEHYRRMGTQADVVCTQYGYRTHYALPAVLPLVTVIIPTKNTLGLIKRCIDSLLTLTHYPHYEVIVVDNGSDDPATLAYLYALSTPVRILREESPFNFSALNNTAVQHARGDLVCLLNNDTQITSPRWLDEMVALAIQPGIGAVGAKLVYPNGRLQHGGVILGIGSVAGHAHKGVLGSASGYCARLQVVTAVTAVTAACLLIRKATYQAVGGLNASRLRTAFNDIDFCLRVQQAGYRNVWTPFAELMHAESATRGLDNTPQKQEQFLYEARYMFECWGERIRNDEYYSPNLTSLRDDFSLATPPRVSILGNQASIVTA